VFEKENNRRAGRLCSTVGAIEYPCLWAVRKWDSPEEPLRDTIYHVIGRAAISVLLLLVAAGCHKISGRPAAAASGPGHGSFEADVRPVLSQYCFNCHNNEKHKGDVVLETFTNEAAVLADRATWEKVLKNLRSRAMPPENKPQPLEDQRAAVANWVEAKLFAVDCEHPDPGRVTIRRLNRTEYNNTIRDLVGVDFHPADDFPADDVGYGFDNIGDVLSLPPLLLEKYLAAATKIMEAAIVVPGTEPRTKRYAAVALDGTAKGGAYTSNIRSLATRGDIFIDYFCATEGEYTLRARAFQQQAGDEPAKMVLRAAGTDVRTIEVRAREEKPQVYEAAVHLHAGTNRFAVAFDNPLSLTNKTTDPDTKRKKDRVVRRRLLVDYVEIVEPAGTPAVLPETHRRILSCLPDGTNSDACARQIIGQFASRAFRRPITSGELDRLVEIYRLTRQQGDPFERGVQVALEAVLVSPHFLFRGEIVPDAANPGSIHAIDDFALASRLSYFLWSSMPDEELLYLAGRGELRRRGVVEEQVQRMLKDPKARALVENFTGQWLQIRNLWKVTPDTNTFTTFNDPLRGDMERETQLFFESIMREDHSLLDFIDGNYSFVNERLAAHYGLAGIKGEEFQKIVFKDGMRGGVLTHGSVLTITSNPTRTSPVKRGKWVLDNLLGTPPPPPPPDVPDLKDQKELAGTLRQKLEQHRKNPMCASCHDRMDPIGFGLDNFNAVGVWRDKDAGEPIDASGQLPGGSKFSGPAELRKILRGKKDLFAHCLTEKMLTYALGRGLEYYDKCAVDHITTELAKHDYRFSVLITEIVKSAPFQMRRGEPVSLAGK